MKGAHLYLPGVFVCNPALAVHNLYWLYLVPFAILLLGWPKAELFQNKLQEPPSHLLPSLAGFCWGSTAGAEAGGQVPRATLWGLG